MKKFIGILTVVLGLVLMTMPAFAGGGQGPIQNGYYTFVWEMPHAATGTGANAPWPQELVDYAFTGGLDTKPDLGYLDGVIPDCGFFQVDTYKIDNDRDIEKLTGIVKAATLNWPEDSSIYKSSKFVENGECEEETTTTVEETTTTTMADETTTTAEETTTTEQETTTTVIDSTTTTVIVTTTSSTPEELPFTGANTGWLVGFGLGLIGAGSMMLRKERVE